MFKYFDLKPNFFKHNALEERAQRHLTTGETGRSCISGASIAGGPGLAGKQVHAERGRNAG